MLAAILTFVLIAGEDVPAVEFDVGPRQAVVKEQPDNARHGDVKVDGRDPVVPIRLEIPTELADLAPALEIIVGIPTLLERDHLGQIAEQQRKRPLGAHDANGHIMLV